MNFALRIKFLRQSKKLKQVDIANAIGLSPQVFNRYEHGEREPDYATLINIANYFDVSLDYLLGRTKYEIHPTEYADIPKHDTVNKTMIESESFCNNEKKKYIKNFKMLRTNRNIRQEDIANYLGISKNAYSLYERGERKPDPETLIRIADYFNVSLDYLLGRTDDCNGFNKNIKNINSVVFYCNGTITDSIELTETKMNLAKKIIFDIQNS